MRRTDYIIDIDTTIPDLKNRNTELINENVKLKEHVKKLTTLLKRTQNNLEKVKMIISTELGETDNSIN